MLSKIQFYFFYIYNYLINLINSYCFVKSVEVVDINKLKKPINKTFKFYLYCLSGFQIFNEKHFKTCVLTKDDIYKVYTNSTFEDVKKTIKKSNILLVNKIFLSFKINNKEFINYLMPFMFYNNSVFDFILFNKSKDKDSIINSIKYKIFGSDKEKEITNFTDILNQLV